MSPLLGGEVAGPGGANFRTKIAAGVTLSNPRRRWTLDNVTPTVILLGTGEVCGPADGHKWYFRELFRADVADGHRARGPGGDAASAATAGRSCPGVGARPGANVRCLSAVQVRPSGRDLDSARRLAVQVDQFGADAGEPDTEALVHVPTSEVVRQTGDVDALVAEAAAGQVLDRQPLAAHQRRITELDNALAGVRSCCYQTHPAHLVVWTLAGGTHEPLRRLR